MITNLKKQILSGYEITKQEALKIIDVDLDELCNAANEIRLHFCDNSFDICTIVNGKSGRCSEDCKYCAQSSHYSANIEEYPLLNTKELKREALYNHENGILRYSVVTSGRNLSELELSEICISYEEIKENCEISLCASHGLLTYDQFIKLKSCGVSRYHNNLESSRKYFNKICTTHNYDDKVEAILNAQEAGLEVCSGGIIGLGETMEDRIDMAFELKDLHINSVPINVLNPIKGTPYGDLEVLDYDEILRVVAIFRFILPNAALRLAGGRGLLTDKGEKAFMSGANASISGDMLTTSGISIKEDIEIVKNLGFEVNRI